MSNAPSKPVSFSRPKVGYFSNRPRIYIYIYINNMLYIVSTPTYFDASASYSGSLIILLCYRYRNYLGYKLNKNQWIKMFTYSL